MIQAEVGGAARVDPGLGVQRPGFMIRDFALPASGGEVVRISSFRGRSNLIVVFPGHSDALRGFLEDAAQQACKLSEQNATLVVVVPHEPEENTIQIAGDSSVLVLHDKAHAAYKLSGAMDADGRLAPLVYLTDLFGEIVSTFGGSGNATPPSVEELLKTLEFMNIQCPECEPPEWPR